MSTTTMAKIRKVANLGPNAPLSEVNDYLDAQITAAEADPGADAGTDEGSQTAPEGAAETPAAAAPAAFTLADVTAAVKAAVDPLEARLANLEATEAADDTGGKREVVPDASKKRAYHNNPINISVAKRFAK